MPCPDGAFTLGDALEQREDGTPTGRQIQSTLRHLTPPGATGLAAGYGVIGFSLIQYTYTRPPLPRASPERVGAEHFITGNSKGDTKNASTNSRGIPSPRFRKPPCGPGRIQGA